MYIFNIKKFILLTIKNITINSINSNLLDNIKKNILIEAYTDYSFSIQQKLLPKNICFFFYLVFKQIKLFIFQKNSIILKQRNDYNFFIKYINIKDMPLIYKDAYYEYCINLKYVKIHSGKILQSNIFSNCISLKHIYLPKNLEYIKSKAFNNCISLKTIYIPKCVKEIGANAFNNCISLKTIIFY